MAEKNTPQPERHDPDTPSRPDLRKQAIVTLKVLLIAGGALGVLSLLDQMVGQ